MLIFLLGLLVLILSPFCYGYKEEGKSCAGKAKYDIKENAR
jgi:hypothetical protein